MPPSPSLSAAAAGGVASAALVAGAALGLWGRLIHRGALVLAGAAAGWLLGPLLADRLDTGLRLTQGVAAGTLAVAGLALARFVWAAALAGVAGSIPLGVLLWQWLPDGGQKAEALRTALADAPDPAAWAWAWIEGAWEFLKLQRADDQGALLLIGVPAAVLLLIGLVRARTAAILMTALLAGVLLAGGGVLAARALRPGAWGWAWRHGVFLAAAAGVVFLLSVVVQYRGAVRSDRRRREAEPKKGRTPAGDAADEDDDDDDDDD